MNCYTFSIESPLALAAATSPLFLRTGVIGADPTANRASRARSAFRALQRTRAGNSMSLACAPLANERNWVETRLGEVAMLEMYGPNPQEFEVASRNQRQGLPFEQMFHPERTVPA